MERLQDIVTTRRRKMTGQWQRPQTVGRKTCPHSNVPDARKREKKEGEVDEDTAKYFQRRPGIDGCQLAWSPPDRQ